MKMMIFASKFIPARRKNRKEEAEEDRKTDLLTKKGGKQKNDFYKRLES